MERRRHASWVLVATVVALLLVTTADVSSLPGGITGQAISGCTCHGPAPSSAVTPSIVGAPTTWAAGQSYALTVSFTGGPGAVVDPNRMNTGGFNLKVAATADTRIVAGSLSAAPSGGAAQVMGGEATHTFAGNDQMSWNLQWTAPAGGFADGAISFFLATNSVNGNGFNTGDAWNKIRVDATGPADTTAPVISGVTANPAPTSAQVTWTTDDSATSVVEYGTTAAYGSTATGPSGTFHSVSFGGLTSETTYHYRVRSTNLNGLESVSGDHTFTTTTDTTPPTLFFTRPLRALYVNDMQFTTLGLAGPLVVGTPLTMFGGANDASGIDRVEVRIDGVFRGHAFHSGSTWRYTWDTSGEIPGNHVVQVTAFDTAANSATASVTVTKVI